MIQENQNELEENLDLPEVTEGEEDTTDWKAEAIKLKEKAIRQRENTKTLKAKIAEFEKPKPQDKTDDKKPDDELLKKVEKIEKMALRGAGLTHPDDVELAQSTAKKWGMDVTDILEDEDFKVKLERLQTKRSNELATSHIKGGGGGQTQAKNTPEYWQAKGVPPTPEQVPDKIARRKIVRSMMKNSGNSGRTFYND